MKEAMLYERLEDSKVRCNLCAHRCTIAEGRVGVCHVRDNEGGLLYTRVYGQTIARHVDPIEKKPLLHFYPGSTAYSVATPGCNFRCRWCQNADISQAPREEHFLLGEEVEPAQIVAAARRTGCRSIAYTYTEPTIFFEYTYDTARLARDAGLANVYVTNGYMTNEMLAEIHPYLDAANVDLKGFRDEVYRRYAGARLQPVLDSLKAMKQLDIWLEVTTLIIPGINDDPQELADAASFIAAELGPGTPWHISRFTPAYQMADTSATPLSTLLLAQEIGRDAGLRYIYVGNVPGESNTLCHVCGHRLIHRAGYQLLARDLAAGGTCPQCGTPVAGRGLGSENS
ncbi:MAG: AmmeMemoRadiSam system radical SAM enzyme [Anaerolineae bacterium]|jgi:pyruvate formate lyase activating enzyme